MRHFNKSHRPLMLASAAALAMAMLMLPVKQAQADDCLLDTTNNGLANDGADGDLAANSGGVDSRLACGASATASGNYSTATGSFSTASGLASTASGTSANAAGNGDIAIGSEATTVNGGGQTHGNIAIGAYKC